MTPMSLQLRNSLTKTVEPFRPLKGRTVRLYTCGPTVYDFAHVGNLRTYVFEDVCKRTLALAGYRVHHVMNITDVGHLTGDADDGEDKVERAAAKQRKSARQLAAFYTRAFLRDLKRLNILPADDMPQATAYIREQVALAARLERRGYAYRITDGLYFDTAKFAAYGRAFGQETAIAGEAAGARIAVNEAKRHPRDFALWKLTPPGVKRQMEWDSPWGRGFPGWHLECSAMGRALLGQPFDIHAGGVDHIPIHHTNEIAQSEAAYRRPLARVWIHGAFLTVDGKRMGKSKGNLITIDELVRRGFEPLAYRMFVLGAHYRSPINFTWEALAAAEAALDHLRERCRGLPKHHASRVRSEAERVMLDRIRAAFMDDLDTPKALAVLWDVLRSSDAQVLRSDTSAIVAYADQVLGLDLVRYLGRRIRIPRAVQLLIAQREDARAEKHWARGDVIRAQIEALGWRVEDTKEGPVAKPKRRKP